MPQRGICDECSKPVTKEEGLELSRRTPEGKEWVADVHKECKAAWLKKKGAGDYAGLEQK